MGRTPPGTARNSLLNVNHPNSLEEKLGADAFCCAATSVMGGIQASTAARPLPTSFAVNEVNIAPSPPVIYFCDIFARRNLNLIALN